MPAGVPSPLDERQLYQFVYTQLSMGKFDADIVNALVGRGVQAERAQTIVQTAKAQRIVAYRAAIRRRGKRRVIYGVIAFFIGALITVFTYSAAASSASGGTYIVAFGPILYGIYSVLRGLADLIPQRAG